MKKNTTKRLLFAVGGILLVLGLQLTTYEAKENETTKDFYEVPPIGNFVFSGNNQHFGPPLIVGGIAILGTSALIKKRKT